MKISVDLKQATTTEQETANIEPEDIGVGVMQYVRSGSDREIRQQRTGAC